MSKRKPVRHSQLDRYRIMKWMNENEEKVLSTSDRLLADILKSELGLPELTRCNVFTARQGLGLKKRIEGKSDKTNDDRIVKLQMYLDELCDMVASLASTSGRLDLTIQVGRIREDSDRKAVQPDDDDM